MKDRLSGIAGRVDRLAATIERVADEHCDEGRLVEEHTPTGRARFHLGLVRFISAGEDRGEWPPPGVRLTCDRGHEIRHTTLVVSVAPGTENQT